MEFHVEGRRIDASPSWATPTVEKFAETEAAEPPEEPPPLEPEDPEEPDEPPEEPLGMLDGIEEEEDCC